MSDRLRLHENTSGLPSDAASLGFAPPLPCPARKLAAELTLILSLTQTLDLPLRIDTVERDGSLVLVVQGELDIATSYLLDEALARARATDATRILVDLLAVSFIDSTALHVLIRHARTEDGRARVRLTQGSPQTQRVFELSGAMEYLPFASD
jgi:anti-anti-sigma factor